MKKIKKIAIIAFFFIALTPYLALAQWIVTENQTQSGLPAGTIYNIILGIMQWILGVVGFIGIIGFVISGIMYLTSAGDDDRIKKAKSAMTWSIVGVIVALMGYVIIQAANSMLMGTRSQF